MRISLGKLITIILITVALAVGAVAVISRATEGFTKSVDFTNENNLVHSIEEYESSEGNFTNGLNVKINSTGTIRIDGTYTETATSDYEFILGEVIIDVEDFYTLSGCETSNLDKYYIKAVYEDSNGNIKTLYSDLTDTMTSEAELTKGTIVTISIVVKPGAELNKVTFSPTLVAGTTAGRY